MVKVPVFTVYAVKPQGSPARDVHTQSCLLSATRPSPPVMRCICTSAARLWSVEAAALAKDTYLVLYSLDARRGSCTRRVRGYEYELWVNASEYSRLSVFG